MYKKAYRSLLHILAVLTVFIYGLFISTGRFAIAEELVISGNGSGAESEIVVEVERETTVEQINEADISTDVTLEADTGENNSSGNVGDTSIVTGDIVSDLTIDNTANYSSVELECCVSETGVEISDNGSDSINSVNLNEEVSTSIEIVQNADINNEIDGKLNTGRNTANNNLGDVSIDTGSIYATGGVTNGPINVHDVSGGTGGGDTTIKISGNGDDSENIITYNSTYLNDINVFNFADIFNRSEWGLNTGDNEANGNVGNVDIITGDIFFDFFIKNGPINVGGIYWGCCDYGGPGDPGDPGDPGGPGDPGDPTDPDDPSRGGTDGDSSGGGDSGGSSESSSSGAGGLSILGLSDTSSEAAQALFFWFGVGFLIFGFALISKELLVSPAKLDQ